MPAIKLMVVMAVAASIVGMAKITGSQGGGRCYEGLLVLTV